MSDFDLDLTQPAFAKTRGDLTLYGAWWGKRLRPCLAVLPAWRSGTPLVIDLDSAWKWNPDDRDASPSLVAPLIMQFLRANGMDYANMMTHHRVLSFVHDHLGDLIRMPVKPGEKVVVADAIRTDRETGKQTYSEIVKRV